MNRKLHKQLIAAGREDKCEICGISEWQGQSISLHVHHIDGNHTNNVLENLQILCPNCHSQTDTYCAKNRKNNSRGKTFITCLNCGKTIKKNVTQLCIECTREKYKKDSKCPSREQLLEDCINLHSYVQISKKYNVSDKTIRKWCKKLEIDITPYKKCSTISKKCTQALVNKYRKPIYQFDLEGNFIQEFKSVTEAAKTLKINTSSLRKVLNKKRLSAGGYTWRWKYDK